MSKPADELRTALIAGREDELRHMIRMWALPDGTGCHVWTESTTPAGYGVMHIGQRHILLHRLAFYLDHGYWPKVCRHTCDNPPCCNPEHLVDGTLADNVRDMYERGRNWQTKATHCPAGHPYAGDNLHVSPKTGWRYCRACRRVSRRKRVNSA